MKDPTEDVLRSAMFEVVENQIRDDDPPETRQTLERLKSEGFSHDEAMQMLAGVVAEELFNVFNNMREFDRVAFVAALHKLPGGQ